eukprot:SAG22_NODE_5257_length_1052_cov_0.887723_1_plen_52_part_00
MPLLLVDDAATQKALFLRSAANGAATKGTYVKGSCPSLGTKANVEGAKGGY